MMTGIFGMKLIMYTINLIKDIILCIHCIYMHAW